MSILALHGFTGCGADFAPLAKLCGGEWHCPDLPGHGANAGLDCSPETMVDFINQSLTTHHSPLTTPKNILIGYSLGARAALLHATQYPEPWDALILISANPGIENQASRVQRRTADTDLATSIEQRGVPAFLEFWQQTPLIRSQQNIRADWRETMRANRLKHQPEGLANSLRQFGQGSCPNLWPELSKLPMPVCLITGEQDTKYTQIAKRMLSTLSRRSGAETDLHAPLSTHTVIGGASHMPHLEQAEESARVIGRFLESVRGRFPLAFT